MAKRKRTFHQNLFLAFLLVSLMLGFGLSSLISFVFLDEFDTNLFLILSFAIFIAFGVLFICLGSPKIRGKIGERSVSKRIKKLAKKYDGYVIDDVMIPGENGRTSQVDHILFTKYAIYAIETKNYSGRIYGSDSQREWTQTLAYGRTKNKLYNPVMQNNTHIMRLKSILSSNVHIENVVIFTQGNVKYIDSNSVRTLREIKYLVFENMGVRYDEATVKKCYEEILRFKENPIKSDKEHVKEIKQMMSDINNNICPRCGKPLVLRNSTKGQFYGCSGYPKCKFTKKA